MSFCKKCGEELVPETKFCNSCGAAVEMETTVNTGANYCSSSANSTPTVENSEGYYDLEDINRGDMLHFNTERRMVIPNEKRTLGTASVVGIILGIVCILLIFSTVFLFFYFSSGRTIIRDVPGEKVNEEFEIELSVDEPPATTTEYTYTISGKYTVKGRDATLCIKGVDGTDKKIVKSGSDDKEWEYDVSLQDGENIFEIELYDPDNKDETIESKTIEIQKLKYAKGTILTKNCGYNNKLHIRSTPEKNGKNNIVYTIQAEEEGIVQIKCLGEEEIAGGYTWAKVEVRGYVGWLGTDKNVRVISTP